MKASSSDNERHQDDAKPQQTSGVAATRVESGAETPRRGPMKESRPLLSTPPEIFAQIISNLSCNDLITLSETSRALRYNHLIERALFTEPISRTGFPLTLEELKFDVGIRAGGFAEDLHDLSELCDDALSLKGRTGKSDPKYLKADTCNYIGKKLNARTGSYVKRLAIPNFLTIADILPYANHCHNIEFLDLSSLIHPIDQDEPEFELDEPTFVYPFRLRWQELLEDDCIDLFTNVRSIKVDLLGTSIGQRGGWERALQNLADLLRQAQNLKCLHIHSPPLSTLDTLFNSPVFTFTLSNVLAANAPKGLTELRLDGMFHNIRNYHTFLNEIGEALPQLRNVSFSIDQDLQMLGLDSVDEYQQVAGEFKENTEIDLIRETPLNCWEYIRMLKRLSDDPRWTSSLKCLKADQIYEINPRALFSAKDHQRSKNPEGKELFGWLKQTLQWTPTFNWYDQMQNIKTLTWVYSSLHNMPSAERYDDLELCRELFQDLKSVGIPVKLLLSTTQWYNRIYINNGSFYGRNFRCARRNHVPEEECGLEEYQRSGPWQWYLHVIGDLVDELTVNWGNTFLRQPVGKGYFEPQPCGHRGTFDKRPDSERAEEEKEKMQPLWTDLAQTFPNIKRLNLHIPAEVYLGDETMTSMLPESDWRVYIGNTIVVKDCRTWKNVRVRADVTFLDRIFHRAYRTLPMR